MSRRVTASVIVLIGVLAFAPLPGSRVRGQTSRAPGVVALRGATILTVTHGTIPNGTILLRDGKIAAVGATVDVPSNAEIVDVTGKFISPGIIDCHSHIANDDINEGGTTVSSIRRTSTSIATSPAA
jgi:imidazolonepropionase-like amidohydrolase